MREDTLKKQLDRFKGLYADAVRRADHAEAKVKKQKMALRGLNRKLQAIYAGIQVAQVDKVKVITTKAQLDALNKMLQPVG